MRPFGNTRPRKTAAVVEQLVVCYMYILHTVSEAFMYREAFVRQLSEH